MLYHRKDKIKEYFCETNVLSDSKEEYVMYWMMDSYVKTYEALRATGTYMKKSQRKISMFMFGSTIGATNYPCYFDGSLYHNLARPYANFKPGSPARIKMNEGWFKNFVMYIEKCVFFFLRELYPNKDKAKLTLFKIALAKKVIPLNCRIAGSFFNHMTCLGYLKEEKDVRIEPHLDEEDVITALFHVGKPTLGGNTQYYSGSSKDDIGKMVYSVPFEHGRLQIGYFNNIVHEASSWNGLRGGINFNLKNNVLDFFEDRKNRLHYEKFERDGFPKNYACI